MSPKKLATAPADKQYAVSRRRVAEKYYEVADLLTIEEGLTTNVCVGLCVLAGIAAGDAICASATGQRYSGQDHSAAAELLKRVDPASGDRLRNLVALKPKAHYETKLLSVEDRTGALRDAASLIAEAARRTGVPTPKPADE